MKTYLVVLLGQIREEGHVLIQTFQAEALVGVEVVVSHKDFLAENGLNSRKNRVRFTR